MNRWKPTTPALTFIPIWIFLRTLEGAYRVRCVNVPDWLPKNLKISGKPEVAGGVAGAQGAGIILAAALKADGAKALGAHGIDVGNAIVTKGRVPSANRVLGARADVVAKAVKTRLFKQPRRRNR